MDWTDWFKKMAKRKGAARINALPLTRHVERAILAKRGITATLRREPLKGRERREDQ
jgi:hypothetical protein